MHGYSAVHVIVFPEGAPVEIQVRTSWQHEWAELFEKLADLIGRGIRYGEPPENVPGTGTPLDENWEALVATALNVAEIIAAVETNSVELNAVELDDIRSQVTEVLARFQQVLGTFG